jgi:endonuclease VIII
MPEGDAIHRAARRLGEALVGQEIVSIETPQPRHALDRVAERLAGRAVRSVDAHGKHLFIRFDGDLTIHSHLRMRGSWHVYRRGERWRRAPRRAWLVVRTGAHEVVEFDGPVLELMRDGRTRFDVRLSTLGPDLLGETFDERRFLSLVRGDDQARAVGDALLDQRNVAGIGNIWKSEGCFAARIDPWRSLRDLDDEQLVKLVCGIRPLMRVSAAGSGRIETYKADPRARGGTWVYGRPGLPCRVCATPIRAARQGDEGRTTFWCPQCQR